MPVRQLERVAAGGQRQQLVIGYAGDSSFVHGFFLHSSHLRFILIVHMIVTHQMKKRVRGQIAQLALKGVAVFRRLRAGMIERYNDIAQPTGALLRIV